MESVAGCNRLPASLTEDLKALLTRLRRQA